MAELTDHELLADFARTGAENAFAALVQRHINLVYSTARRFTGDDTLAADVTQAVFILLARKAGGISSRVVLTGWLYQTARLTAANSLKQKIRRQNREQEAYMQSTPTQTETDAAWKQIAPVLDDAMGALRETDRDAVLLRYFEDKPLAEVGAALGVSEDAARVRVNRALDKLRDLLTKKGVMLGATAIAGAVTANAVSTAPVALASTITTAALTGTTLTLATIAMTTLQEIAVTVALTVTVGAGIYEAKQAHDARNEAARLQAQQAPMQEQIQQLQKERDIATDRSAGLTEEIAANRKNNLELLRLRNEVTMLKQLQAAQVSTEEASASNLAEDDSWEVPSLKPSPSTAKKILRETKPQVRIVDSKYDHFVGDQTGPRTAANGKPIFGAPNTFQSIGIGIAADKIILIAYGTTAAETIFPADMPAGKYDYIANLPQDSLAQLQKEIKTKFGLVGKKMMITTNVFALIHTDPNLPVLVEPKVISHLDRLKTYRETLESEVTQNVPVVDLTGLTNGYEWKFTYAFSGEGTEQGILQAFHDQLGLDLIATNMPVEMLVVEKIN